MKTWKVGQGFKSLKELNQALEDGCTLINGNGYLYKKGFVKAPGSFHWKKDELKFVNPSFFTIYALSQQIGMTLKEVCEALMDNDWKLEGYFSDDGKYWSGR